MPFNFSYFIIFLFGLTFVIFLLLNKYIKKLKKELISEQYQKKEALENYEKVTTDAVELTAVLQAIEDGVLISNLKGQITFASLKALNILATDISTLRQFTIDRIILTAPKSSINTTEWESQIHLPNGDIIDAKVRKMPVISHDQIRGDIYIIHDISSEKQLEKMKLDFVAMAVHQLRTPLTSIKGYLSMFRDDVKAKLSVQELETLERSLISVNAFGSLVENLLSVARINDGKLQFHFSLNSIESVVENVIKETSVTANQKNITVHFFRPRSPLPRLLMDPFLIGQVVKNLLENAIEQSEKDSKIEITLQPTPLGLSVHVRDYGGGIPAEAIPHIFEKFFKVVDHLQQGSKGTGLGLYISKSIIDGHKGVIWVNSLKGKGATFSFTLPYANNNSYTPNPQMNRGFVAQA